MIYFSFTSPAGCPDVEVAHKMAAAFLALKINHFDKEVHPDLPSHDEVPLLATAMRLVEVACRGCACIRIRSAAFNHLECVQQNCMAAEYCVWCWTGLLDHADVPSLGAIRVCVLEGRAGVHQIAHPTSYRCGQPAVLSQGVCVCVCVCVCVWCVCVCVYVCVCMGV